MTAWFAPGPPRRVRAPRRCLRSTRVAPSSEPAFAASSSCRHRSASPSAPRLALDDLRVWAGRTSPSASPAASEAFSASSCSGRVRDVGVDQLDHELGVAADAVHERLEGRLIEDRRRARQARAFARLPFLRLFGALFRSPCVLRTGLRRANQRGRQLPDADRLADVVVHAGRETCLPILGHGVRGHRHDPDGRRRWAGPEPSRRLQPIHLRHLDVHQHDVVATTRDGSDRLHPVVREVGRVAHPRQQSKGKLLVHRVVLGEQDPERMPGGELGIDLVARRYSFAA